MNLLQLFAKLWPFVRPYRCLVIITLILTLISSSIAQVNAIVLDWTVDQVNNLVNSGYNVQGFLSHDASARSLNIDKLAHTISNC